jgi:hypothetical protein
MLSAVICCISVLCTASLASFGMDMAAVMHRTSLTSSHVSTVYGSSDSMINSMVVVGAGDEDVVRLGSGCLLFHEFFAAVAVLVSILYYAIVKASLMAMGAVIMTPPNPHPVYAHDELSPLSSDGEESSSCCSSLDGKCMPRPAAAAAVQDSVSSTSITEQKEDELRTGYAEEEPSAADVSDVIDKSTLQQDKNEFEISVLPDERSVRGAQKDTSKKNRKMLERNSYDEDDEMSVRQAQKDTSKKNRKMLERNSYDEDDEMSVRQAQKDTSKKNRKMLEQNSYDEDDAYDDNLLLSQEEYSTPLDDGNEDAGESKGNSVDTRQEKFSAIKIWTNIYGLSIGIYCLVYSLMLPNELSAFVFCVAALAASIYEWFVPCMDLYLRDSVGGRMYGSSTLPRRLDARMKRIGCSGDNGFSTRFLWCKRCLGYLCIFGTGNSRSVAMGRSRQRMRWQTLKRILASGALAMPCLISLIIVGLVFKVMEAVFWQDAISKNKAFVSGGADASSKKHWPSYSPTLIGALFSPPPQDGGGPGLDTLDATVNIMFPIIGVLALKSMRKTKNIRQTIELAVPVCGLNSLCIVCIILMQNSLCLNRHFSATMSVADATKSIVPHPPMDGRNRTVLDDASAIDMHPRTTSEEYRAIVRFQPVLAALGLPFPLVCSIVCIVSAGRNHRVMVSFYDTYVFAARTCVCVYVCVFVHA